jgi:hypothetical protein
VDDPVTWITESLAGADEAELTDLLSSLGRLGAREPGERAVAVPRTPLPAARECPRIRSEIEWV